MILPREVGNYLYLGKTLVFEVEVGSIKCHRPLIREGVCEANLGPFKYHRSIFLLSDGLLVFDLPLMGEHSYTRYSDTENMLPETSLPYCYHGYVLICGDDSLMTDSHFKFS